MSFLLRIKKSPFKSNFYSETSRFANKRIDPSFEKANKKINAKNKLEKNPLEENDEKKPFSLKTQKKEKRNFFIFEIFSMAFGFGLTCYVLFLIKKKREESKLLDKMNVR